MSSKRLIVIGGPTASGKTGVSVELAKHFQTVIFSADSRQFYQEIGIGTAKPTLEEQSGIKHHFIDSHQLTSPLSAGQFEKEALALLEQEFENNDTIILVGGSGMFISALIHGIDEFPHDKELRQQLNDRLAAEGLEILQKELATKDATYYAEMDAHNPVRVIRALEIIELTGQKYSEQRIGKQWQRNFSTEMFVLNHDRQILYDRINQRVHQMMEDGLEAEVKSVNHLRDIQSLNTVGYKEMFQYFDQEIELDRAIELIQQNSRRYAKRQITWFKRYKDATWIDYTNNQDTVNQILSLIKK